MAGYGTKFAISLTSYRYLGDGGTNCVKLCMMVHRCPWCVFSPFGRGALRWSAYPKCWPLDCDYL